MARKARAAKTHNAPSKIIDGVRVFEFSHNVCILCAPVSNGVERASNGVERGRTHDICNLHIYTELFVYCSLLFIVG